MGLIPIQIPEQNFELIRDQIGAILTLELNDQVFTNGIKIWRERLIAFSSNELPAINVSFDNTPYDNENAFSRRGDNVFHVDVHVQEKNTEFETGDILSNLKSQRIAGIISYILSSVEYLTLGFDPGVISSKWVSEIKMGRLTTQDSLHITVARITFHVIANESVEGKTPTNLLEVGTSVKLNQTDKGYLFELNI